MKNHSYLTLLLLFLLSVQSYAQNRRALIVGINDYYFLDAASNQILRDPKNSLKGCVNDAKSVKELIINRFAFKQDGIRELYNEQATKRNILAELDKLLSVCKPGDNAFFYYSGHGMQMPNASGNSTDEAIAPTDVLYQKNGYILSLQLAAIFNKFVDKKVTLTTIFDCCHSWGTKNVVVKQGNSYIVKKESNVGSGRIFITKEIGNGAAMTDILTLELDTPLPDETNSGTEIRELNINDFIGYTSNLTDTIYANDTEQERILTNSQKDKGEALTSRLLGKSTSLQVGPAKRINSNFLFMSATNDDQKAMEKTDESRNKHGVFTKSLLEVYKKNPATISSQQLFDKIQLELKKRYYTQTPTLRCAPERKTKNLPGVLPAVIKNDVFTKCISAENGTILLDKGTLSGLSKGNILQDITNPAVKVEVVALSGENNAVANVAKGSSLVGHTFKVLNWYVKSDPLLRVYLPNDNMNYDQVVKFVNSKIKPLVSAKTEKGGFSAYVPFEKTSSCSRIFVRNGKINYLDKDTRQESILTDLDKATLQSVNQNRPFFVYLPVPSEVSTALAAMCRKDQNIELVDDPAQADVSFYCAYTKTIKEDRDFNEPVKITKEETENEYIDLLLNYRPPTPAEYQSVDLVLAISKETVGTAQSNFQHQPLAPYISLKGGMIRPAAEIAGKLYEWLTYTAGKKGVWLNGWARK